MGAGHGSGSGKQALLVGFLIYNILRPLPGIRQRHFRRWRCVQEEKMTQKFFTHAQMRALLENGRLSELARKKGANFDPVPVVKLFTPDANATWLISEIDPIEHDLAFGLCDLGLGFPELGSISLIEIRALRGRLGLPIERDPYFKPDRPLSQYAEDARRAGRIEV